MQFNLFTDYSFRVLVHAGVQTKSLTTITQISEAYSISRHHVVKVVHRLAQLGYLTTHRGRTGGIELARPADQICVGAVARDLEEDGIVECFRPGTRECCIFQNCALRAALAEAQEAFFLVLEQYTVADLIQKPQALRRRLGISAQV